MQRILVCAAVLLMGFAGCLSDDKPEPLPGTGEPVSGPVDAGGQPVTGEMVATFLNRVVGENGPEPTMGVTSNGHLFFQALEKTMRSTDHGATWEQVSTTLSAPTTLDPMLWVDTVTDRVYANQLYLGCSYLSWTDDEGATWVTNPIACGTPVNDHQKITTGPYAAGSPLANPVTPLLYPNVLYYAYNGLVDSRVAISLDGGLTFPYTAESNPALGSGEGGSNCAAGLHGHITAAPDGTVYVPNRSSCAYQGDLNETGGFSGPVLARSSDNGLTWVQREVHNDIGTADHDKNPELGIDVDGRLYMTWPGANNLLYYSWSEDQGDNWSPAVLVSSHFGTATFPVIQAGDAGRVAIATYAVDNASVTGAPDLVPDDARWSLYVSISLNGLDEEPTFVTYKVTDDPIQIGAISTNSGDNPPGSRNLLDFIDMVLDAEGRVFVAWADGCTGECATDAEATMEMSRSAMGMVTLLDEGPSLYAETGRLGPIAA